MYTGKVIKVKILWIKGVFKYVKLNIQVISMMFIIRGAAELKFKHTR